MVTDDERREVAARLRSANEHSCSPDCELRYALDGSHDCKGNGCTGCHRDAFDRLADLIEPRCDRDALLRLSDEIYDTSCDNHGELTVDLIDIWGWAQAICESLGV